MEDRQIESFPEILPSGEVAVGPEGDGGQGNYDSNTLQGIQHQKMVSVLS